MYASIDLRITRRIEIADDAQLLLVIILQTRYNLSLLTLHSQQHKCSIRLFGIVAEYVWLCVVQLTARAIYKVFSHLSMGGWLPWLCCAVCVMRYGCAVWCVMKLGVGRAGRWGDILLKIL